MVTSFGSEYAINNTCSTKFYKAGGEFFRLMGYKNKERTLLKGHQIMILHPNLNKSLHYYKFDNFVQGVLVKHPGFWFPEIGMKDFIQCTLKFQ